MEGLSYTVVLGNKPGARIGIVKYGETGYYQTDFDAPGMTLDEVKEAVKILNERLGVPEDVAESMVYASCFGWHTPVAHAAHMHFDRDAHQPAV